MPSKAWIHMAKDFCSKETIAYEAYKFLSERIADEELKTMLRKLAEQERKYIEFWSRLLGEKCGSSDAKLFLLKLLHKIFGPAFILAIIEREKEKLVSLYKEVLRHLDGKDREILEKIIREEEKQGRHLLDQLSDVRMEYMGYIALGLADAIVEITGVHAGFLGATSDTIMAGIAGLVVGLSAALSMAGAAYLQAKHGSQVKPSTSALITGISYIVSVVILALPYFLINSMLIAFAISLSGALVLAGLFTFYSAVIQGKNFVREFAESTSLLIGTAAASFLFGQVLGHVFGIEHLKVT